MNAVRALLAEEARGRRSLTRSSGLTETELNALEHLVEFPSTPGELARLLTVSSAASTGVVDRLERRGHVERRKHPTDRRRLEVHVTAEGRAELLHYLKPSLDALRALEKTMSAAEQETVLRYLHGAKKAFEQLP